MSKEGGEAPQKASLPAAQAEQVVQYLLAHKYHLTALELLVESQGAGHNGEFPELESFFNNPETFPPEDVVRYAHSNALEIQASARDREQKLQLLEYELRVTKEDLQGLTRRMSIPAGTPNGSVPASPRVGFMSVPLGGNDGGAAASRIAGGTVFRGHGQAAESAAGKAGGGGGHVTSTATEPDELAGADLQQLGDPTEADQLAVLSSMVSYCLHLGLRSSALTLQEEASDMLPGLSLPHSAHQGQGADGLTLWKWFKVAKSSLAQQGVAALSSQAAADAQLVSEAGELRQQIASLQATLAKSEEELAAARATSSELQAEVALLKKQLEAATAKAQADGSTPRAQGLLTLNSSELQRSGTPSASAGAKASGVEAGEEGSMHKAIVSQLTELLPKVMPALTIKTRLEILPMVQAVILASRDADTQRALTGLVFNGVATPDPVQRGAVVALCAGVAAKLGQNWAAQELLGTCTKHVASASAERRVLVAEMLAALMDPRSVQVLQMGGHRGVLSSSGATTTTSSSTGAAPAPEAVARLEGPLIDCGAQSSALLHAVTRLAEDRMEQVREAAVVALVALLQPACLPFSRAHYSAVEDLALLLVCDSQTVSSAALQTLVPAFQTWCRHTDLVATSLLPRLIGDISRLTREAPPVPTGSTTPGTSTSPAPAPGSTGGSFTAHSSLTMPLPSLSSSNPLPGGPTSPSITQLGSRPSVGTAKSIFAGPPPGALCTHKFACWEHQAMHQLLELVILLLPSLTTSALKAVPSWVVAAAAGTASNGHATGPVSQEATQPTDALDVPPGNASAGDQASPFGSLGNITGQYGTPGAGSTGCVDEYGVGTKRRSSGSSSMNTFVVHQEVTSTMELLGGGSTAGGDGLGSLDVVEAVAMGELDSHMMFAAWAMSDKGQQWKRMQWVMQFLLHELIEVTRALGVPSHQPPVRTAPADNTGKPPLPPNTYTSSLMSYTPGANTALASLSDSCYELHCQLARVVASIATTFGQGWTQAVLVPVYCSAAACAVPDLYTSQSSSPVLEAAEQLAPQNAAAAQAGRACILPHLITAVLPYALESALPEWMMALTQANHDLPPTYQQMPAFFGLLQPAGAPLLAQWVQVARKQLAAAVSFACTANTALIARLLQVLERLVQRKLPTAGGAPVAPSKNSTHSPHNSMGVPQMSGLHGALSLSLAHGLLSFVNHASSNVQGELNIQMPALPEAEQPGADPQQLSPATTDGGGGEAQSRQFHDALVLPLARKVMSMLMVMLSEGDGEVQSGVVGVLLEVLIHYKGHNIEDVKLVQQVCVVYDGLLASGSPMLVASVLNAVQQLASSVGPTASNSPAAAQQIEWVLQVVFSLASQQLPPPPAGLQTPTPYPTDQQRQLACQLLNVTHAVFMHDIRVASIQTALHACVDALVKVRTLLPDPYSAVLTPMQANNRGAAGNAMSNAVAAAAAMSAITAQPAAGHWGASGILGMGTTASKVSTGSAPSLTAQFGQPAAQYGLSPQQQQYLQYQQKQQQSMSVGSHGTAHQQQVMNAGMHQQQAINPAAQPNTPGAQPPSQVNSTLQATAQNLGLTDRLERLRSRFRKKSVADGELDG